MSDLDVFKNAKVQLIDELIVEKGSIHAYQIFDVGAQIDLKRSKKILAEISISDEMILRKNPKSILIVEHPVTIQLGDWTESIQAQDFIIKTTAKLWSFGALSVRMTLALNRAFALEELSEIANYLASDQGFHSRVRSRVKNLTHLIESAIEKPAIWDQYEEYLIFNFESARGVNHSELRKSFQTQGIASIILTEKPMQFSEQMLETVFRNIYQYTPQDLTLIHWNAALIYDPDDAEDITSTIEVALCLMLEMRFFDDLLDHQLKTLYQSIEHPKHNILANPYGELSRTAALQYIDISDLVDRISNGFKITGDYYYATIYRAATKEFQVEAWRKSVDVKLDNLAEVSILFQGEINERRNQLMEVIIIALIAFEVVPLIFSFFSK